MTNLPETADYVQAYNADRPTDPKRSALIVVDMQYATGHRDGPLAQRMKEQRLNTTDWRFARIHELVIPNTRHLIDKMRTAGGEIVYVTVGAGMKDCRDAPPHMRAMFEDMGNYEGSRAHEIIDELKPEPRDHIVRKTSIGAFASTGIDHLLRMLDCESLFMTGVSTNMCVETTAREAADRGYAVTMVEDACATTHEDLHHNTMRNFNRLFGKVRSTEEVLARLA
jgi:nicotinamidase-related amidase